jgi:hypothetical protein
MNIFGSNALIDLPAVVKLLLRLALDLAVVALIIGGVHYRRHRRTDYVFTFFTLNVLSFTMCFLLRKVPMEVGMGLGMFAVFGVLRYRTEPINMRDLTYLFICIGLAVVNASANKSISVAEVVLANLAVVAVVVVFDGVQWSRRTVAHTVMYDRIDLLSPTRRADLLADLSTRLGMPVHRVDFAHVDLLKDAVELTAFSIGQLPAGEGK